MTLALAALVMLWLVISTVATLRSALAPRRQYLLAALRCAAALLLLLALFNPRIAVDRLVRPPGRTAVLVDNSESMKLFGGEALLRSLSKKTGCDIFLFNDSLVPAVAKPAPFRGHSALPHPAQKSLAKYHRFLLISDGACPPAFDPALRFCHVECRHLVLDRQDSLPFLRIALPEEIHLSGDSAGPVGAAISGYSRGAAIAVVAVLGIDTLFQKTIPVPADHRISETLSLPLPKSQSRPLSLRIIAQADSLSAVQHCRIIPAGKDAAILWQTNQSTLLRRFLGRSLAKNDIVSAQKEQEPAALIVEDFSQKSRAALARHPATALVAAGCIPAAGDTLKALSLTIADGLGPLPPCDLIVPKKKPRSVLLAGTSPGHGTLPLLWTDTLPDGRAVLHCSITQVWRLLFSGSADSDPAQNAAAAHITRAIAAFIHSADQKEASLLPAFGNICPEDSIALQLSIPFKDMWKTAVLILKQAETTERFVLPLPLPDRFSLPPHRPGSYSAILSLGDGKSTVLSSTVFGVSPDMSERQVSAMDTAFLNRFSTGIQNIDSVLQLPPPLPFSESLELRPGAWWGVLVLILMLLCADWGLRRLWRVE